jgi:hypothetical protein
MLNSYYHALGRRVWSDRETRAPLEAVSVIQALFFDTLQKIQKIKGKNRQKTEWKN